MGKIVSAILFSGLLLPRVFAGPLKGSLLQDIVSGNTDLVTVTDALNDLRDADLASIGETHSDGLERNMIASTYAALSSMKQQPLQCIVEDYHFLIAIPGDPVEPQMAKICPKSLVTNHPTSVYDKVFDTFLDAQNSTGRAMTHTGFRHILPWGVFYPVEFKPHPFVDLGERGNLTTQLPRSFKKKKRKMVSLAFMAFDDLIVEYMEAAAQKGEDGGQLLKELETLFQSQNLSFQTGEQLRIFRLNTITKKYPFETSYLALINHSVYGLDIYRKLLLSSEWTQFLKLTQTNTILAGHFRGDSNSIYTLEGTDYQNMGIIFFRGRPRDPKGRGVTLAVDTRLNVSLYHSRSEALLQHRREPGIRISIKP